MSASSDSSQLELKVKTDKEVRFWTVLEREIGQEIPEYLKIVLKVTKFDNLASLANFNFSVWYSQIEDFMKLSKSNLDKKDLDMLKDLYFDKSFKLPPGNVALLWNISKRVSHSFDKISQALQNENAAAGSKRAKRN